MVRKYQILKDTILQVIQNSGLDIGAAYFIMKDVFSSIEKTYYAQLNKECLEEAEKVSEEVENKNE